MFFARVADALEAAGVRVERVLFCPGDALFWRGRPAIRWSGPFETWPAEARRLMRERRITDVVGLGDGRFLHRAAFEEARRLGLRVHVLEQGWLRPGWLTLEPDRFGAWRPDAQALSAATGAGPLPVPGYRSDFAAFAAMDVAHHLANLLLGPLLAPAYERHEVNHPVLEWLGWAGKALALPRRQRGRRAAEAAIAAGKAPLFLLPLQLETDFQIRDHGPPGGLRGVLATVAASFAAAAPPAARLIVKPHPLDPGLTPWRRMLADGPAADRAIWLDGGDLDALLPRLAGVVTVNSTVGLSALRAGCPVAVLGRAVYEGLAHRGPLDAFWKAPPRPDPAVVAAFCAALAQATQLPGTFDGDGMEPGARAVAERLLLAAGAVGRA